MWAGAGAAGWRPRPAQTGNSHVTVVSARAQPRVPCPTMSSLCGSQTSVPRTAFPPCALGALLNSPGSLFSPSLIGDSPLVPGPSCCPFRKRCQQLRVVFIAPPAWGPLPGAPSTRWCSGSGGSDAPTSVTIINQPPAQCQVPITGGVPSSWGCVKIAARPSAVQTFHDVPDEVMVAFPGFGAYMKTFLFDFSPSLPEGCAKGRMLAFGKGGSVQATMEFKYRWCGPGSCKGVTLPQFQVLSNSGVNARFTMLDDTSFLSSDPCTPSTVVLQLQQWCCDGEFPVGVSTPPTPGQGEGVLTAAPTWYRAPVDCVDASTLQSCAGGACFREPCA